MYLGNDISCQGNFILFDLTVFSNANIRNFGGVNYFHNVTLFGDGFFEGDNTFNNLTLSAGKTYILQNGKTQTVTSNFYASGNPCFTLFLKSYQPGSQANLCINGGITNFDFVDIRDINASCNTISYNNHSIDNGNNSNIAFI